MLQKIVIFLISLFSCKNDFVQSTQSQVKYQKKICFSPISVNPPVFPGGTKTWKEYLLQNIDYPAKAQSQHLQGIIQVQMIIDLNGNVTQVKALNDLGGGLAQEAERVIKKSPRWKPATQKGKNGRNIFYRFIQSITFTL